jgi:uncharacterized protein YbaA (DUF1428 family)
MKYVDGYVLPVPTKNVEKYRKIASQAGKIWKKHGALHYFECAGDDINVKFGVPFTKQMKSKPNETIIFAFVVFKSRAHRDKVNAKVMSDPALSSMCDPKDMPFDCKRMVYGGFKSIVEA